MFMLQSCHMFTNVAIDPSALEHHVRQAQSVLSTCQRTRELQNELYCQLIKQTSPHQAPHIKTPVQVLCFDYFMSSITGPTPFR